MGTGSTLLPPPNNPSSDYCPVNGWLKMGIMTDVLCSKEKLDLCAYGWWSTIT